MLDVEIVDGVTECDKAYIEKLLNKILQAENPIGHIRIETTDVNPTIYLGFGTWELWGQGKVPVGVNSSETEFDTVEKTGGEKLHSHPYGMRIAGKEGTSSLLDNQASHYTGLLDKSGDYIYPKQLSSKVYASLPTQYTGAEQTTYEVKANTGETSNLQPYITCYMWKRIA